MQLLNYCPNCGNPFERELDEQICKGCSKLPKEIKDEILAAKEKLNVCYKCGEKIGSEDHYCHTCGEKVSDRC
jgi:predicted amidophosphoribosyltransferase